MAGKEGGQTKDYGGGLSRGVWVLEAGFLSQFSGLSANYTITQRHVLNRIIALWGSGRIRRITGSYPETRAFLMAQW